MDALRLAGRLKSRTGIIRREQVATICEGGYEIFDPDNVAAELIGAGYLVEKPEGYYRTSMAYPAELSTYLKAWVARRQNRRKKEAAFQPDTGPVNTVCSSMDPNIAKWFGYPQHPVYLTGRVHYLPDDE